MVTRRKKKKAKSFKIFFSETRRHRALIFGMKHFLVDLYQDCSYDVPGVKTGPAPGVTSAKQRKKKRKTLKFFFSETIWCRALIFCM